jgi:hypothetical protein
VVCLPRLVSREQDFLAQRAQHLDGKCLVRDDEVDAALVAQRRADHRLFVERRDHGAIDGLRQARFGREDAVLEQVQCLAHAVAAQLVRIADPRTQLGLAWTMAAKARRAPPSARPRPGPRHATAEPEVWGCDLAVRQGMVPLQGTMLHLVPAEQATASSSSCDGTNRARAPSLNCCRAIWSTRGLPSSGRLCAALVPAPGKPNPLGASAMV